MNAPNHENPVFRLVDLANRFPSQPVTISFDLARLQRGLERSHLLVAAGRRPNTDGLNLRAAGGDADPQGHVMIDDGLRTSAPATGDVNGWQPFTRVCQEEAKIAYANAFEGAAL